MWNFGLEKSSLRSNYKRRSNRGFTFVEVMIGSVIMAIVGIGTISVILIGRETAEYDKQRIAAISAARKYVEGCVRHQLYGNISSVNNAPLDDFNTANASDDLKANVSMKLYEVSANGIRGNEIAKPPEDGSRIEADIIVKWNRTGRFSTHQVIEKLQTYFAPDI